MDMQQAAGRGWFVVAHEVQIRSLAVVSCQILRATEWVSNS